jgi:serine protease inhibitor
MDPFALLDRLDGRGDIVLAPYGVRRALDVVRRGARGETRAALDTVLGPEEAPEIAAEGLALAQAAWLADGYAAGPALTLDTGPLDAGAVNAWAREKTHGMIREMVDRFDDDDKLAITDAAYMDAKWTRPFRPAGTRPFAGAGEVAMMAVEGGFEHADGAVRLPYGDGDLRFVAMLDDWRDVEWRRGRGTVELPRFSSESDLSLTAPLRELGLGPAFEGGDDLEALVTGPGPLALSRIDQRARVDVDEQGTRAAAVTTVRVQRLSGSVEPPFHLIFDRPFAWAVEHAPTSTLLFVGRVRRPSERST